MAIEGFSLQRAAYKQTEVAMTLNEVMNQERTALLCIEGGKSM